MSISEKIDVPAGAAEDRAAASVPADRILQYVRREVLEERNLSVLPLLVQHGLTGEVKALLKVLPLEASTEGWRVLSEYGYVPAVVQFSVRQLAGIGCAADLSAARDRLTKLMDAFATGAIPVAAYPDDFEETCSTLSKFYSAQYQLLGLSDNIFPNTSIVIDNLAEQMTGSPRAMQRLEQFYETYCVNFTRDESGMWPQLYPAILAGLDELAEKSPRAPYWQQKRREYLTRYWNFCRELAQAGLEDPAACAKFADFHNRMVQRGMMDLPAEAPGTASAREAYVRSFEQVQQAIHDREHPEEVENRENEARNAAVRGAFLSLVLGVVGYFAAKYVLKWVLMLPLGVLSLVLEVFDCYLLSDFDAVNAFSQNAVIVIVCGLALISFVSNLITAMAPDKKKRK